VLRSARHCARRIDEALPGHTEFRHPHEPQELHWITSADLPPALPAARAPASGLHERLLAWKGALRNKARSRTAPVRHLRLRDVLSCLPYSAIGVFTNTADCARVTAAWFAEHAGRDTEDGAAPPVAASPPKDDSTVRPRALLARSLFLKSACSWMT
jgi:hypothetical protein